MNYIEWANEYYKDAENLKKTINKYESILKEGKDKNEEKLNKTISFYTYVYYDLVNTAKMLEKKGKKKVNAA